MGRVSIRFILFVLAALAELSLATEDCDLECVLARLADLEQKQRENEADKAELHGIIAAQQSTIEEQTRRINSLEETVKDLKDAFKETKGGHISNSQVTGVDSKVHNWQPRHRHAGNIINSRARRAENAGFAFTAYLDHDVDMSAIHTTLKCNRVILNEGNAYNVYTGVFTCPEDGVYLLTFSIGGKADRGLRVFMIKNSQNLVDANADSVHATQELQGGNTAIVRLSAGDAVWLESAENNNYVEGDSGFRLTTFSGVYLYP